MTEQLLQRGDVVAFGGQYFVVWKPGTEALEAFPIRLGVDARCGDYLVSVGGELSTWNITELCAVVSAGERQVVICFPPLRAIRVGRCSGGLICRIVAAAARAYAAQFVADHRRSQCNNNSSETRLSTAA